MTHCMNIVFILYDECFYSHTLKAIKLHNHLFKTKKTKPTLVHYTSIQTVYTVNVSINNQ